MPDPKFPPLPKGFSVVPQDDNKFPPLPEGFSVVGVSPQKEDDFNQKFLDDLSKLNVARLSGDDDVYESTRQDLIKRSKETFGADELSAQDFISKMASMDAKRNEYYFDTEIGEVDDSETALTIGNFQDVIAKDGARSLLDLKRDIENNPGLGDKTIDEFTGKAKIKSRFKSSEIDVRSIWEQDQASKGGFVPTPAGGMIPVKSRIFRDVVRPLGEGSVDMAQNVVKVGGEFTGREGAQNIIDRLEEYKPNQSPIRDEFLSSLSAAVPSMAVSVGGAMTGNPYIAGAAFGSMGVTSAGGTLREYDEYKSELGEDPFEKPVERAAFAIGTGLVEMASERFGAAGKILSSQAKKRLIKSGVKLGLKTTVPSRVSLGSAAVKEYAKKQPTKFKKWVKNLDDLIDAGNSEGVSEAVASLGQDVITNMYKEFPDKKSTLDIMQNMVDSYKIGAIMGVGVGPLSFNAQSSAVRQRRQAQGGVVLTEYNGEAVEIISRKQKDGKMQYTAMYPDGEVLEIDSDKTGELFKISNEQFQSLLLGKKEEGIAQEAIRTERQFETKAAIDEKFATDEALQVNEEGVEVFREGIIKDKETGQGRIVTIIATKGNKATVRYEDTGEKGYASTYDIEGATEMTRDDFYKAFEVDYIPNTPFKSPSSGERIIHPTYGEGRVIAYDPNTGNATLEFTDNSDPSDPQPIVEQDVPRATVDQYRGLYDELKSQTETSKPVEIQEEEEVEIEPFNEKGEIDLNPKEDELVQESNEESGTELQGDRGSAARDTSNQEQPQGGERGADNVDDSGQGQRENQTVSEGDGSGTRDLSNGQSDQVNEQDETTPKVSEEVETRREQDKPDDGGVDNTDNEVRNLAERIARGDQNFTAADLQLQINEPKKLEQELNRIQNEKKVPKNTSKTRKKGKDSAKEDGPGGGKGQVVDLRGDDDRGQEKESKKLTDESNTNTKSKDSKAKDRGDAKKDGPGGRNAQVGHQQGRKHGNDVSKQVTERRPDLKDTDHTNATSTFTNAWVKKNKPELEKVANKIMDKLGKNKPELEVFESELDVIANYPHLANQVSVDGVSGMFVSGKVVVVASNPKFRNNDGSINEREVADTVIHEMIGHYGLRGSLEQIGGTEEDFFMALERALPGMKKGRLDVLTERYTNQKKFDDLDNSSSEYYQVLEEYIAHEVQLNNLDGRPKRNGVTKSVIDYIKGLLEKMGFNFSDSQLRSMISNARRFVEVGENNFVQRPSVSKERINAMKQLGQLPPSFQIYDNQENINFEGNENQENQSATGKNQESIRKPFQAAYSNIGRGIEADQSQQGRLDKERFATLQYAKDNDLWIEDATELGTNAQGGAENTLFYNEQEGYVYKSNNLMNNEGSPLSLINRIQMHNALFPETTYEFVGFTGLDNGSNRPPAIEVVLKQRFITDARKATQEEIDNLMEESGYENDGDGIFEKDGFVVTDMSPKNVLVNPDGEIFVVDPYILRDSGQPMFQKTPVKLQFNPKKNLSDRQAKSQDAIKERYKEYRKLHKCFFG